MTIWLSFYGNDRDAVRINTQTFDSFEIWYMDKPRIQQGHQIAIGNARHVRHMVRYSTSPDRLLFFPLTRQGARVVR